ncbi:MAG: lipid-A-disaccharide synthase-related protein [Nodosilinea sp.]
MSLLFLSNGHGEDLNSSLIIQALRKQRPDIAITALPLVGEGDAYRRLGVELIGPTQALPSGGMVYTHPLNWLKDLMSGLLGLTWQQLMALGRYRQTTDLVMAVGDIVPIFFAHLVNRPYAAFLVSTSSYYEGRLRLPWLTRYCLRHPRCVTVFTRDRFTCEDLHRQGMAKAQFAGYPIMDALNLSQCDLELNLSQVMVAILPGSRVPEALRNLELQLQICEAVARLEPTQFRVALVKAITPDQLQALAVAAGWDYHPEGRLSKSLGSQSIQVRAYWGAFADIIHHCDIALGMAGTAVEQAVGLGKPVVQIAGQGPQFTYRFAEAQMRLLGDSVTTIGHAYGKIGSQHLEAIATTLVARAHDQSYRQRCLANGLERVGEPGGSAGIATGLSHYCPSPRA